LWQGKAVHVLHVCRCMITTPTDCPYSVIEYRILVSKSYVDPQTLR
jgi:hypothetical protein